MPESNNWVLLRTGEEWKSGATVTDVKRWTASLTSSNSAIFWWGSLRSTHPTDAPLPEGDESLITGRSQLPICPLPVTASRQFARVATTQRVGVLPHPIGQAGLAGRRRIDIEQVGSQPLDFLAGD